MDFNKFLGEGLGLGGIGAGIGGLFSNNDPTRGVEKYYDQIPGAISPYYDPYFQVGKNTLPGLQNTYGQLTNNPGEFLNNIGSNYHQSPGFQFALQQALQGANHASAAGGMAGSPQNQQQNMGIATNLANQDYNNWLGQATGLFGEGLNGQQNLAGMGFQAGNSMAEQIAQALAQRGNLQYASNVGQNQARGSALDNIFGGAATLGAFL